MNKRFLNDLDLKRELESEEILSKDFWDAFEKGLYPKEIRGILSHQIEKYASLIEGIGFVSPSYKYNYIINIVAIKNVFFISVHSKGDDSRMLGTINYYPSNTKRFKKKDMKYRTITIERDNPVALRLLYKIRREIFNRGIEIRDKPVKRRGALAFKGVIKRIVCTARWEDLIQNDKNIPPERKAELIAKDLNNDPLTIAYYGSTSPNLEVKSEAIQARNRIAIQKLDITTKWLKHKENHPKLSPMEIAEIIAKENDIDPISVAGYARASNSSLVRSEANEAYNQIYRDKLEITEKWLELKEKYPNLLPIEIAEMLGKELNLNPITISGRGRISNSNIVKSEAHKAYNYLCEKKYEITTKWLELKEKDPDINPEDIVKKISQKIKIKSRTVASYARTSKSKVVKSDAYIAYNKLYEKKYGITKRWLDLKNKDSTLLPEEIANVIAKEINIDPSSVATYTRFSNTSLVKSEANIALKRLYEKKKGLTKRWLDLKQRIPKLLPIEIAQMIAKELNINPRTVSSNARYSDSRIVKTEAYRAHNCLYEKKYGITKKWEDLKNKDPTLLPEEITELIAQEINVKQITVASYARFSNSDEIKSEANKIYYNKIAKRTIKQELND